MQQLETYIIKQNKEWGEILSGFETRNKYVIQDEEAHDVYYAAEVGGNVLLRLFLRSARPFTMEIYDSSQRIVLRCERPFRFFFKHIDIYDSVGKKIGELEQHFALLERRYSVRDSNGAEVFTIVGPLLHPWTFHIKKNTQAIGKITKKWSGLGKEMFTDADNFMLQFPVELEPELKSVLLGAVFLIDFAYFENRK